MRITLVTLIFLFLAGCSLPYLKKDTEILSYDEYKKALFSEKTNQFKINGKLSLFVNKKGQSGKILWNFENEKDTSDIFNPFNSKIAEIILYEPEKKSCSKFY
jgi:outer membrane biogenesis lipoprotein LolB